MIREGYWQPSKTEIGPDIETAYYAPEDLTRKPGLSAIIFGVSRTQSVVFARVSGQNESALKPGTEAGATGFGLGHIVPQEPVLSNPARIYLCQLEQIGNRGAVVRWMNIKSFGGADVLLDDAPHLIQDQLAHENKGVAHLTEIYVDPHAPERRKNFTQVVPVKLFNSGPDLELSMNLRPYSGRDVVKIDQVYPYLSPDIPEERVNVTRLGREIRRGMWEFPSGENYHSTFVSV